MGYVVLAALVIAYLVVATPTTLFTILVFRRLLRSGLLYRWVILFVGCLFWIAASISPAEEILARMHSAGRSMPAVGADWRQLFRSLLFEIPLWCIQFVPAYFGFGTALYWTPLDIDHLAEQFEDYRNFAEDWTTGPKRVYGCGALIIALAVAGQLLLWLYIHSTAQP